MTNLNLFSKPRLILVREFANLIRNNIIYIEYKEDTPKKENLRRSEKRSTKYSLANFQILKTIGTGTFGRVCLVKEKEKFVDSEPLALKCL